MEVLDHFSIPFMGLKIGLHQLKFEVDNLFFDQFENTIIKEGAIEVTLDLDKRENLSVLEFHLEGYVVTDCDRCMEKINLPINTEYILHVKYSEDEIESTDEVIFIAPKLPILNVAQYVYEYIHLSIPMVKAYDCESDPDANCNYEVLEKFEVEKDEDHQNPIWDALNDLNLDS